MNKFFKKIAIILCIAMIAPTILSYMPAINSVSAAEAATKASLYSKSGTIGELSSPEYIYISDQKDAAKYTFKSSNAKVAKVDKYGSVSGISQGTAKITVKETYKSKTVTVGTYKITVKKSKLYAKKDTGTLFNTYYPLIDFSNFKAKYTYTTSDKNVIQVTKNGLLAVGAGTVKISVTETYKKVARELGTITVTVVPASINSECAAFTIATNSDVYVSDKIYLDHQSWNDDVVYSYVSSDPSIVAVEAIASEYDSSYVENHLKGIANGTATVTVNETYKGTTRVVGTVSVTVAAIATTALEFDAYYLTEENGVLSTYAYVGYAGDPLTYYLTKTPYDSSDVITFVSSDVAIATVDAEGVVTGVSAGTATITATAGSFSAKVNVIVE
ncbi:MAG: Ig-like domain-containing protein [Mobilitalea sp.]